MQENIIDLIQPTPKLLSKKCKIISQILNYILNFSTIMISLLAWYIYDYFIAIATLFLVFIVMGIIRSKLRNISIPLSQQEYQYSDKDIAIWFTSKEICNDELETRLEKI